MDRLVSVLQGPASSGVAGAVAGVAHGDEQGIVASGIANLNTGLPFTADTGWLLGSVTKVLVGTAVMRLVERGLVDLDDSVQKHLPDFALRDNGAAEQISVRMLLNHTNGIDADSLFPVAVRGRDASRSYTECLKKMGVLFDPGAGLHYSNPGYVLAARVIEERTGLSFEDAIEAEVFTPAAMRDSTAIQTRAMLRSTAIGAFAGRDGGLEPTTMFTLPESGAGAGTTVVTTAADMLSFGRMHLAGGVATSGERILTGELITAMRVPTYDLGIPQAPPIGIGWWLIPMAGTTVAWHSGGSPGGRSSFTLLPEHGAVIVSFATGPGSLVMNDLIHIAALEEITGRVVEPPFEPRPASDLQDLSGRYASFQQEARVTKDRDNVVFDSRFVAYDEAHGRTLLGYAGDARARSTAIYECVAERQYAKRGTTAEDLKGLFGRMLLLYGLPAAPGRRAGLHTSLRYLPRVGD